jgi:hypothetical protein
MLRWPIRTSGTSLYFYTYKMKEIESFFRIPTHQFFDDEEFLH